MANATLKQWLDEAGFDWSSGTIVYQPVTDDAYCPGWAASSDQLPGRFIQADDPILTHEFYDGYGSAQAPRIFARDATAIYFPSQYDGSTWLEKIVTDPLHYLQPATPTPYPGGG